MYLVATVRNQKLQGKVISDLSGTILIHSWYIGRHEWYFMMQMRDSKAREAVNNPSYRSREREKNPSPAKQGEGRRDKDAFSQIPAPVLQELTRRHEMTHDQFMKGSKTQNPQSP